MKRIIPLLLVAIGLCAGTYQLVNTRGVSDAPHAVQLGLFMVQARFVDEVRGGDELKVQLAAEQIAPFRALISVGILIAALLALALTVRGRRIGPAAHLRDSLALGAASLGWVMTVHPWLKMNTALPPQLLVALGALAACGMMASLWLFGRFAANFPVPVREEDLPDASEWKWYWSRLNEQRRARGQSWTRALYEDTRLQFSQNRLFGFLRSGLKPERGAGNAILDARLHRFAQSRTWLVTLCVASVAMVLLIDSAEQPWLPLGAGIASVLWVLLPAFMYIPMCMAYWEHNYAAGDEAQRRMIRWMLASIYVALIAYFTVSILFLALLVFIHVPFAVTLLGILLFWMLPVAWFLLLLALVASIFLRGAVEPALVLRHTFLYGTIVVVMTIALVAVESVLESHLVSALQLPGQAGVIITGTLVALGLGPMRDRVDRWISNWVEKVLPDAQIE